MNIYEFMCLHRKFLVYNLILRNLKIRYRKSFFGMLWTVLIPAGSASIYYLVFEFVLKVKIDNYLLLILGGLIPWTFFSSSLSSSLEVIVANYGLLNKVPLPPNSLTIAEILTHFLNFALSLPIIAITFIFYQKIPTVYLIQFVPLTLLLLIITYSIGLIFGLIYAFFRDFRYLFQLILQFWFYLTPVMYTQSMIPEKFQVFLHLNPVAMIFIGFQKSLVFDKWLTPFEWLSITSWTLFAFFTAKYQFQKHSKRIVEIL